MGLIVALLIAACGAPATTPTGETSTPTSRPTGQSGSPVPELQDPDAWINSEPLRISELRGKVVLLDFWTYTCINCLRTLPHLKAWYERYRDDGLVMIGVHTPEFEFEKDLGNVQRAVKDLGVTWPVALDNGKKTWTYYRVRAWPTKVLIGPDGTERYRVIGEGEYPQTEEKIRELLTEIGRPPQDKPSGLPEPDFGPYDKLTEETYAGYNFFASQFFGNEESFQRSVAAYTDPGKRREGFFYLQGTWESLADGARYAGPTETYTEYLALPYTARVVYATINNLGEGSFRVLVTVDGKPLTATIKGADVVLEEGKSYLVVDAPRMYEVVAGEAIGFHELRLHPGSQSFVLSTFTFGP
ncbi:MAG: redoxin domain-containing protein [Chloroflexi bacterium]|nr:redoxin domain-containing protein [Chloroflexota bacterium]